MEISNPHAHSSTAKMSIIYQNNCEIQDNISQLHDFARLGLS